MKTQKMSKTAAHMSKASPKLFNIASSLKKTTSSAIKIDTMADAKPALNRTPSAIKIDTMGKG